jgi:folate-dependent phosphoribosylglycinamide formyltransferase PurN
MLNNVAVLCSKRAPALEAVLPYATCVITTHAGAEIDAGNVPLFRHPIRRHSDRRAYDALTAHVLREMGVDTVLLLGYLYVLTDVMLSAFPQRIFNIHDSDLTVRGTDGERRYVGLHSTRDAILAGERETRSTLHLVTEKLDGGPILALSRAYPVAPFVHEAASAGHMDIVKAYAYAQREWMMRDAWPELARAAVGGGDEESFASFNATCDLQHLGASPFLNPSSADRQLPTSNRISAANRS